MKNEASATQTTTVRTYEISISYIRNTGETGGRENKNFFRGIARHSI